MVEMLTNLGDRLTKSEARKLVQNADATGDGHIDYTGKYCTLFLLQLKVFFIALCDKLVPSKQDNAALKKSEN